MEEGAEGILGVVVEDGVVHADDVHDARHGSSQLQIPGDLAYGTYWRHPEEVEVAQNGSECK